VFTSGSRRNFLKTIGSAAIASALPRVVLAQAPRPVVAVFWEPRFPSIQGCGITRDILQQALTDFTVQYLTEAELIARLSTERFDLLITPFGSAFPKRAWPALLKYLRGGGNWFNIGGVPLSRPVVADGPGWRAESHQTAYHKQLGITHSFPVKDSRTDGLVTEEVYELYVKLSSTNSEPDEAGSDGPREGYVEALITGSDRDGRAVAAPVIQIDRMEAEFAGGRWVFANFSGSATREHIRAWAMKAAQGASRIEVRSNFACYRQGEIPSLTARVSRPKGELDKLLGGQCRIEVRDGSGRIISQPSVALNVEGASAAGSHSLSNIDFSPGFYTIKASVPFKSTIDGSPNDLSYNSGFWFYDEKTITNGKPLTVDKHFFYRDGEVFPVTGATYMASDVHRRFLFDPNPLVWDRDFRLMKQAGVNMVRTGIWTGWKKYMPTVGKVHEGVLRAFDAFLLTAHKHDIPVIFTFFAFLPETWGGLNAYLDPRAVKAQQEFISAFTKRYPRVDDVMWDFINEPSFCSPKYLWNCRPNYDEHEKAAWKQWLKDRYPARNEEELVSHLQQLWRTTSADPFDLPQLKDFDSVHLIDDRQPLKTLDYRLFAQDMFIRWTRQMTEAVRINGNPKQLITVGQDEAGLGDSPNIQFFAKEIDFTSLHNWWANDDLVWDSVLAKAPSKLSLMEETGVMFYEKADAARPWRSEQDVSNLLERKMALSIGADGAGFIEWVWNTNPYMNSTNEVGIGFHRIDGTAKPELQPFLAIAKFMGQHGKLLRERRAEPVAMVIPHSQMFSPRSFAHEATRRCVRAMYYHCGVPLQAVSEYTIADYSLNAKLIIVPSPFVLTQKCWDALLAAARGGAVVAISGVIDADDHALPVERSKLFGVTTQIEPVSQSEAITIGSQVYTIRYEGEKMQRIEKSVFPKPLVQTHGTGKIIWCPLPLEVGDSMTALVAFYKLALAQAGVSPVFTATPHSPSVLVLPSLFRDVALYTFVSEIDRDVTMQITHLKPRISFPVTVRAERTAMALIDLNRGSHLVTQS
jgi:Cellulase (glycosyl hydrolase family 5)